MLRLRLRLAVFASCSIHESTGLDLVQDWITLKLAVRIHISKGEHDFTDNHRKGLKAIFKVVWLVLIFSLISFIIININFYRLITSDLNYKFSSD